MRILISPIRYMRKQRARRKQLATALHMLSVSGVVRAGHIEPRYFEAPSHVDALYRQTSKRSASDARVARSSVGGDSCSLDWTKLRQMVGSLRPSRLQIEQ
jgi:hydroxymethylpyrimidine/phosphomethylpyrimidine kinase